MTQLSISKAMQHLTSCCHIRRSRSIALDMRVHGRQHDRQRGFQVVLADPGTYIYGVIMNQHDRQR
jgi:hypothetical protein